MRTIKITFIAALGIFIVNACSSASSFNKKDTSNKKIEDLLAQMTLEEKVGPTVQIYTNVSAEFYSVPSTIKNQHFIELLEEIPPSSE